MTMTPTDALQRVSRLITILTLVRSHDGVRPLGRTALAEECACDVRTIQRDLDLLAEAGLALVYDPAQRAYRMADRGWVLPATPLTAEDAVALALARGLLSDPSLPQQAAMRAVLDKLTRALPSALQGLAREAAGALLPGQAPRDYSAAPLTQLVTASAARHTVEIDYQSRSGGSRAWRRVDPYAIEPREGRFWELHAWCHTRNAVRTFALDQVQGMRETGEPFTVREEWQSFADARGVIGGLRGGSPVTVNVDFAPDVAPYALDRQWPPGLSVSRQQDGGARLTGTAQGVEGMVTELLRWRRHVRVLGGPELRAAIAEEAAAIFALYQTDPAQDG